MRAPLKTAITFGATLTLACAESPTGFTPVAFAVLAGTVTGSDGVRLGNRSLWVSCGGESFGSFVFPAATNARGEYRVALHAPHGPQGVRTASFVLPCTVGDAAPVPRFDAGTTSVEFTWSRLQRRTTWFNLGP